jgi:hypothetical protein
LGGVWPLGLRGGHHLSILRKVKNGQVEAILNVTNPFLKYLQDS